jgi:hypothetical protein
VTENFTWALFGDSRVSKAVPFGWLRALLRQRSQQCGVGKAQRRRDELKGKLILIN